MLIKSSLLLLIAVTVIHGCALPDTKPSWSLIQRRSLRVARAVISTDQRMNCLPSAEAPVTRVDTSERVNAVIALMQQQNLDALIVPTADAHQSEYVAPSDQRRKAISGFGGSAGTAVILADGKRALWTDGRYFLEAENELDCTWLLMKEEVEGYPTILEWLKESLPGDSNVGADATLTSAPEWIEYEKELADSRIKMVATKDNLIDEVAPPEPAALNFSERPIQVLELQYAGKRWEKKVAEVRNEMQEVGADMMVITALDEVAWLLNLRGGDVAFTPVFKSYAVIDEENVKLFIKKEIKPEIDLHLHVNQCEGQECVEIRDYNTIKETISGLSSRPNIQKILLPSKLAYSGGVNYAIYSSVPEEKRMLMVSPILYMKARKNPTEIEGMRKAHKKDAVALIDFLSFMEEEMSQGNSWTEMSASDRLEEFRAEQDAFEGSSFETISAFGSNGAIMHYKPENSTNAQITDQAPYLLDSGGQYRDGTTDVTRTMHYGTPTAFQIEAYTRVLMGALDVAMLVFPKGTKDTRVDVLARRSLYKVGLDYKHGTGHGIGMFLNIHESPTQMRIYGPEEHELEDGQFLSDEPGYYQDGEFGIRLETILSVVPRETKYESRVPMFAFEAMTLVPFEPKFIDNALLNKEQCAYLNEYHARVESVIGPMLTAAGRTRATQWMTTRTVPMDCSRGSSNSQPQINTGSIVVGVSTSAGFSATPSIFYMILMFLVYLQLSS